MSTTVRVTQAVLEVLTTTAPAGSVAPPTPPATVNSETILNDIFWNLSAALNSTDTTLTVAAVQGAVNSLTTMPYAGSNVSVRLRIDHELLLLTDWTGNTFTVVRGIEGTTAASHLIGAEIDAVVTRGGIDARLAAQSLCGTFAAKPAAGSSTGVKGRLYLPTDGFAILRDSGGSEANSWHPFGPVFPLVQPPGAGAWTDLNVAANSATTTVDYIGGCPALLSVGGSNAQRLAILHQAAPTAHFSITAMVLIGTGNTGASHQGGICLVDPVTSKVATMGLSQPGSSLIYGAYYSNPTTFGTTLLNASYDTQSIRFLRLDYDGTQMNAYASVDGVYFHQLWTLQNTFLVPTAAGFFLNAYSNGSASVRLLSWQFS